MNTKLTLTIEERIIDSAKRYARFHGKSLSGIVENYLKVLASKGPEKKPNPEKLSPRVEELMGVIELPEDFDYKRTLANAIIKKNR